MQLIVLTPDDLKSLEQGKVLDCGENMQIICDLSIQGATKRLSESEEINESKK